VRLEGLGKLKNPMTSSGIEPAITKFLAAAVYFNRRICLFTVSDPMKDTDWQFRE
jgi:hypothetical protein